MDVFLWDCRRRTKWPHWPVRWPITAPRWRCRPTLMLRTRRPRSRPNWERWPESSSRVCRTSSASSSSSAWRGSSAQLESFKDFSSSPCVALAWVASTPGPVFWTWLNPQVAMVSGQFQSSFRAVSKHFQSSFRAVLEQFSYDFLMENLAIQNPDSTLSQVENKGPALQSIQSDRYLRLVVSVRLFGSSLRRWCCFIVIAQLNASSLSRFYHRIIRSITFLFQTGIHNKLIRGIQFQFRIQQSTSQCLFY